jgi:hypothetical protein
LPHGTGGDLLGVPPQAGRGHSNCQVQDHIKDRQHPHPILTHDLLAETEHGELRSWECPEASGEGILQNRRDLAVRARCLQRHRRPEEGGVERVGQRQEIGECVGSRGKAEDSRSEGRPHQSQLHQLQEMIYLTLTFQTVEWSNTVVRRY